MNIETKITNSLIEREGSKVFSEVVGNPNNLITSRALAFVMSAGSIERKHLLSKIGVVKRREFLRQLKKYRIFHSRVVQKESLNESI